MDHVAIMSKSFGDLIDQVLTGKKTVESRWSKNKIAPWNKIKIGEKVYFKNAGGPVIAVAEVEKVLQFDNLNPKKIRDILNKWPLVDYEWAKSKNYCVLIFLKNPRPVKPFKIDKTGFGTGAAWMCVENIEKHLPR